MINKIVKSLTLLYLKKDKDYGNSVEKSVERFGEVATKVRVFDKMNRFKSLTGHNSEVNESIEDTLLDMLNYIVMAETIKAHGEIKLAEYVLLLTTEVSNLKFGHLDESLVMEWIEDIDKTFPKDRAGEQYAKIFAKWE